MMVILQAASFNIDAACNLYAYGFVKGHTGAYEITDGKNFIQYAGAFIEIFGEGERSTVEGDLLQIDIMYGIVYTSEDSHYRFIGQVFDDNIESQVTLYTGENVRIGTGTLTVDPGRCGDAHHIAYNFRLNKTEFGTNKFSGSMFKNSDIPIVACKTRIPADDNMIACLIK